MNSYTSQAALHRALAHPVRLRILDLVARQEACVCHLTAVLRKPQPYVSQQLGILREAGLITDRREATLIFYSLASEHLRPLMAEAQLLLRDVAAQELDFPAVPTGPVSGCPCPHCRT